jgi:acyl-coenzyme A synthetase/AMP-(fatty) acid ligase
MEIFGSTETGAIASRRTLDGAHWHLYDGVSVRPDEEGVVVVADHLHEPVRLKDKMELCGERRFRWLGRDGDVVKIAGKRGSLVELNRRLNQIDGVLDGVFVTPPQKGDPNERIAALVVAPALSGQQILKALARHIDPVFLPRPIVFVDRLPLNETGKLPRDELLRALARSAKVP